MALQEIALQSKTMALPTLQSCVAYSNQAILTFSDIVKVAGVGDLNPAYLAISVDGQPAEISKASLLAPQQGSSSTGSRLLLALSPNALSMAKNVSVIYTPPNNGSNVGFLTDTNGVELIGFNQPVETFVAIKDISTSRGLATAYKGLILEGAALAGYGNAKDNTLMGNDLANILDGRGGADTMTGLGGDDKYFINHAGDTIIEEENAGVDLVESSISHTLSNNVENLKLTGSTVINGTGNSLNNTITGNNSVNILDGKEGNDILIGGKGGDTYIVNSATDIIKEVYSNSGDIDTVQSTVSWELGLNLENLSLLGSAAANATGNHLNNKLIGNTSNNIIDGGTGGIDTMTGLGGADTFTFLTKPSNFKASSADHITDFLRAQGDKIQIKASAFGIIGNPTLSVVNSAPAAKISLATSAQFIYDTSTGNLHWNQDGLEKGAGSGGILAILDNKSALRAEDLILI